MGETTYISQQLQKGYSLEKALEEANLPKTGQYLTTFICKKGISIEVLAELADLNKTTVYRICNNKMRASSNVLIRLSRILEMNFEETQKLLKCASLATLSGGIKRDIIIIDGIIKNKGIADINDELLAHDFPDLFTNR